MTGLIIAGCVLLALALIGRLRVGAAVSWSEDGLFLRVKAGPLRVQVLPPKPEKKPKKEKKPKQKKKRKKKISPAQEEEKQVEQKRGIRDTLSLALRFVPLLAETAGRFKRKLRVDRLRLHVIWGAPDPAAAGMGYGAGNAVMGMLWPLIEHNFNIKEREVRVDVDFERAAPTVSIDAQITLMIWQSLSLVARLGCKAIRLYLGSRREQSKQKAVQA